MTVTDIHHLPGYANAATDTLSRLDIDALETTNLPTLDLQTLAVGGST